MLKLSPDLYSSANSYIKPENSTRLNASIVSINSECYTNNIPNYYTTAINYNRIDYS